MKNILKGLLSIATGAGFVLIMAANVKAGEVTKDEAEAADFTIQNTVMLSQAIDECGYIRWQHADISKALLQNAIEVTRKYRVEFNRKNPTAASIMPEDGSVDIQLSALVGNENWTKRKSVSLETACKSILRDFDTVVE